MVYKTQTSKLNPIIIILPTAVLKKNLSNLVSRGRLPLNHCLVFDQGIEEMFESLTLKVQ
jgi:hypothetical protein